MKTLILDLEIQKPVAETGGWSRTGNMKISVACVYKLESRAYRLFDQNEVGELKKEIEESDRVVTYNGWWFDFPVIYGINRDRWRGSETAARLVKQSYDLYGAIRATQPNGDYHDHGGWRMSDVAWNTIKRHKAGDGADAPGLFKDGKIGLLYSYCAHDVTLLTELYQFALRYGFVLGANKKVATIDWRA